MAAISHHLIDIMPRNVCCRSHDRAHQDKFSVTQESVAFRLGVRGVSITRPSIDRRSSKLHAVAMRPIAVATRSISEVSDGGGPDGELA